MPAALAWSRSVHPITHSDSIVTVVRPAGLRCGAESTTATLAYARNRAQTSIRLTTAARRSPSRRGAAGPGEELVSHDVAADGPGLRPFRRGEPREQLPRRAPP